MGSAADRGTITLKNVATLAQVSVATASNALTGSRRVGAMAEARVLQAAAELGYQRNEIARSLRTGQRDAIGLVIPDVRNAFWADMVGVIERRAAESGFQIALCNTDFDGDRERAALARLPSSVDGVLLFSTEPDPGAIRPLLDTGFPVVVCDEGVALAGVGGVSSDNRGGARAAATHLVECGGATFGLLQGPEKLTTARERSAGFLDGLAAAGVPAERIHWVRAPYSFDGGAAGAAQLLGEHPGIDAMLACTDNQALGAIATAQEFGRTVPDQVMVCGFDDIVWASRSTPALTTVRQDTRGMAQRAFEMLMELLAGGTPTTEVFPVTLVERESTRRRVTTL